MQFIGREKELTQLNNFWLKKDAQLIVIYGKRRIGKTELIKQFSKNKAHIYFLAQQTNELSNLKILTEKTAEFFQDDYIASTCFADWLQFFKYLKHNVKKPMVIAIDEFPYLFNANKGISSIFQAGWDEYLKDLPIMLILCGSSIGMMEKTVLTYKAPLYGRRTGQMLIKPMPFSMARKMYPGLSFKRSLELYSIAGGNPCYLSQLNPIVSTEANIKTKILSPEQFLYNEIDFILMQELREPRNYFVILKALASGKNRGNEIVNETGIKRESLHKYLQTLENLHIIKKEFPVTEKNPQKSRKGIYIIEDQFFKFWLKYILPHKGYIEEDRIDFVYKRISRDFNSFVAQNYELIAIQQIKQMDNPPFPVNRISRWWDRNREIDIVGIDEEAKKILFGEVKWSNKKVGTNIYNDLKQKAGSVEWYIKSRINFFCLFSKSGFTQNMMELARDEGVWLFEENKLVYHP